MRATATCTILLMFSFCSAPGPVLSTAEEAQLNRDLENLPAHYLIGRAVPFLKDNRYLGIYLYETSAGPYFEKNELSIDRTGQIRLRRYQGPAFVHGPTGDLVLRGSECYNFTKKDWEAGLIPTDRWDCDHIEYRYSRQQGEMAYAALHDESYLLPIEGKNFSACNGCIAAGTLIYSGKQYSVFYMPGSKRVVRSGMKVQITNKNTGPAQYSVTAVIDQFVFTQPAESQPQEHVKGFAYP